MAKRGRPQIHVDAAARVAAYRSRRLENSRRVTLWLSTSAHERLFAAAAAWDCTISEAATRIFEEAGAKDQAPGA
jgi:hypothetical protein